MVQPTLPGMEKLPRTKRERNTDAVPAIKMSTNALHRALSVNQFKNTFDPTSEYGIGEKDPGYLQRRKDTEQKFFGIDPKAGSSERPIYGYLDSKKDTISYNLDVYGDTNLYMKWPREGQNVTTTFGDSLNVYNRVQKTDGEFKWSEKTAQYKPDKLTRSHSTVFPHHDFNVDTHIPYQEVQWHDHPTPREDIQAVNVYGRAGGDDPTVYPQSEIAELSKRHKELAGHFRAAGLSARVPVVSHIEFSYRPATLFDDNPQALDRQLPRYGKFHDLRKNY